MVAASSNHSINWLLWSTPKSDWLCQRWRSCTQSAKTRPRADCGSDHELLIAKFRVKLKKVGKTTRPFRYDLNQIPSDYTVEVRNRFKGPDLIDRVPEELWTEVHDIVQEAEIKSIPEKKKCRKAKWLSEEALEITMNKNQGIDYHESKYGTSLVVQWLRICLPMQGTLSWSLVQTDSTNCRASTPCT